MDRASVSSSNIRSIGYDRKTMVLEVEFNGGAIYQYTGVPATVHDGVMKADSKGKYLNAHVKDRFPCRRIG